MQVCRLKGLFTVVVAYIVVVCGLNVSNVYAGYPDEKEKSLIVSVQDAKALTSIKRIVVFMSGPEEYYVKVLQDALSIELRNLGWNVVSRLEIETAVARDFEKWASLPDSVRTQSNKKGDDAAVTQLVNADTYLTGTVLFGRHQYTNSGKDLNASSEKLVITTVSFQIVNVPQRKTVFEGVLGYINGKSEVFVAQDVRQVIAQYVSK